MRTLMRTFLSSVLASAVVTLVSAQTFYEQEYTPRLGSHESRVKTCSNPTPYNLAAYDDFRVPTTSTVSLDTIVWWGTLRTSAQFGRPYYIAAYKDNGNCLPALGSQIYRNCIKPEEEFVTWDCKGERVYRFKAVLNPPLVVDSNRYWLQISESDEESANPGYQDFGWSAHRRIKFCPAAQSDAWGVFYQPLLNCCDDDKDDLAFGLYG